MVKMDSLVLAPTTQPRVFLAPDGRRLTPPEDWDCLPPGDAGLTRRVKALGPTWTVQEKRGRKLFSQGVWAKAEHIAQARAELQTERSTEAYAKRRQSDLQRREREQSAYTVEFAQVVRDFLRFSPRYAAQQDQLARLVTAHATPVGSGTVARTERIPVEERASAAVIAWLRHQTTAYDDMSIPRIKGMRREVRRELAQVSRALLDVHRSDQPHSEARCPLCHALSHAQPETNPSLSSISTL